MKFLCKHKICWHSLKLTVKFLKIALVPMRVLAPCLDKLDGIACPPINTNAQFCRICLQRPWGEFLNSLILMTHTMVPPHHPASPSPGLFVNLHIFDGKKTFISSLSFCCLIPAPGAANIIWHLIKQRKSDKGSFTILVQAKRVACRGHAADRFPPAKQTKWPVKTWFFSCDL